MKIDVVNWSVFMSLINTLLLIVLAIAGVGDAGGNNIWDDWGETLKIKTLERFETVRS